MKIIFMGTPEFAVPSLEKIINSQHQVLAVVTGMDKPVGRGQKLSSTPVKQLAIKNNIPVLTPISLKHEQFIASLKTYQADIYVVVAFRILPSSVFSIPEKGTINLHGSLLPKYRGAAPINWAIMNGETKTGVTTFIINKNVDTGAILLTREIEIGINDSAGDLHDRMCIEGADLLMETLNLIEAGKIKPQKQTGEPSLAPKITKDICHIDWTKKATEIYNLVRGLTPFPRPFTFYKGKELKVIRVSLEDLNDSNEYKPGEIIKIDNKGKIFVATGEGVVSINELQLESKRKMATEEFLRGYQVDIGEVLK